MNTLSRLFVRIAPGLRLNRILLRLAALTSFSLLAAAAHGAVDFTLSSNTVSSASTTPLTITVTGLSGGAAITVERYGDLNANSTIDAGDLLTEFYTVTDGAVSSIDGVRNINIPGDEDLTANGQIAVDLALSTGPEFGRGAGPYLLRVASPTTSFPSVTHTLTVTNPAQPQSLSGTVMSGGSPVARAVVAVLRQEDDDAEFVLSGQADASGNFSLPVEPGSYVLLAVKSGYVMGFGSSSATVNSGVNTTGVIVNMTATTRTFSGKVADDNTNVGLPGVQLFFDSEDGFTIASTDANGNFSASVSPGIWQVETADASLFRLGYLPIDEDDSPTGDTTSGNVTGADCLASKATALIVGHVTDAESNPLPNIGLYVNLDGQNLNMDNATDADGYYVIGVLPGSGYVGIESNGSDGYIPPNSEFVTIAAGEALTLDFEMLAVTAHITGTVTDGNGLPIAGLQVGASNASTYQFVTTDTAEDGTYDLGLVGGTWYVQLSSSSAEELNVVGPNIECTLADGNTLSGVDLVVLTATAHITGTVTDGDGLPITNANISSTTSIEGVPYTVFAQTDNSGFYSLLAVDATWILFANAPGFPSINNETVIVDGGDEVQNFVFTLAPFITYHPESKIAGVDQNVYFFVGYSDPLGGTTAVQWEVSVNGGSSWTNVPNSAPYTGANSETLQVTTNTTLNGYLYRCVVTNAEGSDTSNPATLSVVTSFTFTTFKAQYFNSDEQANSAISGDNADPDSDGLNNLLEYALGLDPKFPNSANQKPSVIPSGGRLLFSYLHRLDTTDLTYTPEVSSDLVTWNSGPSFIDNFSVVPINSQLEMVHVRDRTEMSSTAKRFMRLKVTRN